MRYSLPFKGIDLFSDTLSKPTAPMMRTMAEAEVGDEQKGEDPTTRKLEEKVAELTGHTAALFLPSATMANEIALMTLCERGDELIAAENCHLFEAESGGPAIHAQVLARPIVTENGIFTSDDIRASFQHARTPLTPISRAISVENTANMGGGIAWTKEQLESIHAVCEELDLRKHLDGARLFNAVVRTGLSAKTIASRFDTVTVCLSKGLGCPMGAVLAFDARHFPKVRRLKQLMGGALRQSGYLAAMALYALENNIHRLHEDHENAQLLAQGLEGLPHLYVEKHENSTNMIFLRWISKTVSADTFYSRCLEAGLRFSPAGTNRFRAVTYIGISKNDIQKAIEITSRTCKEL